MWPFRNKDSFEDRDIGQETLSEEALQARLDEIRRKNDERICRWEIESRHDDARIKSRRQQTIWFKTHRIK